MRTLFHFVVLLRAGKCSIAPRFPILSRRAWERGSVHHAIWRIFLVFSFPLAARIILNFERVQSWVAQKLICCCFLKQRPRTLCHDFPLTNCYDYAMQHNFPSLISADFNERLISLLRLSLKILKLKSINLCQLFCIEDVLTLSQGYFDQRTFWPENVLTGKQMTYHPTSSKFSIHHSHLQAILENHL